jgi:hypothetical protein
VTFCRCGRGRHPYVKETAFDVPTSVVTITSTVPNPPGSTGTMTSHDVVMAQCVGACCPSNQAWMCPSGMMRFAPQTMTVCPADPPLGETAECSGAFPAVDGTGTVVTVAVELLSAPLLG